ncbi:hypothetical protein [Methyloglobulus sp.]|uniref:hypothetical protein n=1 Tax=Methyloglobulus sp. TaxID=2518622 RepID=UPI00398937A3
MGLPIKPIDTQNYKRIIKLPCSSEAGIDSPFSNGEYRHLSSGFFMPIIMAWLGQPDGWPFTIARYCQPKTTPPHKAVYFTFWSYRNDHRKKHHRKN